MPVLHENFVETIIFAFTLIDFFFFSIELLVFYFSDFRKLTDTFECIKKGITESTRKVKCQGCWNSIHVLRAGLYLYLLCFPLFLIHIPKNIL